LVIFPVHGLQHGNTIWAIGFILSSRLHAKEVPYLSEFLVSFLLGRTIFGPRRRVPKSHPSCCSCCCCYQFSKKP